LRGGWSVRQLDRQIATQFFARTRMSRNKAAILPDAKELAQEIAKTRRALLRQTHGNM
jgi:predicted nuclease of restriction endonuclease-like (RecB) superfamily